jgi:hypothetical protein
MALNWGVLGRRQSLADAITDPQTACSKPREITVHWTILKNSPRSCVIRFNGVTSRSHLSNSKSTVFLKHPKCPNWQATCIYISADSLPWSVQTNWISLLYYFLFDWPHSWLSYLLPGFFSPNLWAGIPAKMAVHPVLHFTLTKLTLGKYYLHGGTPLLPLLVWLPLPMISLVRVELFPFLSCSQDAVPICVFLTQFHLCLLPCQIHSSLPAFHWSFLTHF